MSKERSVSNGIPKKLNSLDNESTPSIVESNQTNRCRRPTYSTKSCHISQSTVSRIIKSSNFILRKKRKVQKNVLPEKSITKISRNLDGTEGKRRVCKNVYDRMKSLDRKVLWCGLVFP